MNTLQHYDAHMTAEQVDAVRAGEAVEVYPKGAESRTVVLIGSGLGPVNGHYRFCLLQMEHLDRLMNGGEVVICSYDNRFHLTVRP